MTAVGKITLRDGREAVLLSSGTWQSRDRDLEGHLNLSYDPAFVQTPGGRLPYGHMAVTRAAIDLGGRVTFSTKLPPADSNVVY